MAITLLCELFRKEGWTTHLKVVHVRHWHYGDPNNKTHAYVVAIKDKEFGEKAKDFAFPPPVMSDENCFTGRDYVNDVVPRKYHRTDAGDKALPVRNNVPGAQHKVAQYAPGQGPVKLTHALYGQSGRDITDTDYAGSRQTCACGLEGW